MTAYILRCLLFVILGSFMGVLITQRYCSSNRKIRKKAIESAKVATTNSGFHFTKDGFRSFVKNTDWLKFRMAMRQFIDIEHSDQIIPAYYFSIEYKMDENELKQYKEFCGIFIRYFLSPFKNRPLISKLNSQ